ncbi:uncharacterized protein LOC110255136 [Exaiptasia diaphana]|uniref:Uncharacterized protein n=1 Tax=Exaiptasia diaphana TaxID=2652724 RepID=A0A913YD19_EXADI|nr:uncharacterized protein LOC110255136 [Exaiptasia diaphana]
MFIVLFSFFATFLVFTPCLSQGQVTKSGGNQVWKQINLLPVCFEGRGDKPGELTYLLDGTMVGAMKLVYKSGSIRCAHSEAYKSRWGCYHFSHPSIYKHPLNIIVTDVAKNKVYPLDKHIAPGWSKPGLWYYLPFTDSLHSNELVFTNYLDPFYLPQYGRLQIWYGEDLKNWYDSDNVGRVCVDVFIHGLS